MIREHENTSFTFVDMILPDFVAMGLSGTAYLAGPMTGIPEHNYPMFFEVAKSLRDIGFTVESPAERPDAEEANAEGGNDVPWEWWMKRALKQLIASDMVVLLPGWQHSRGARCECQLAWMLQMPVVEVGVMTYSLLTAVSGTSL